MLRVKYIPLSSESLPSILEHAMFLSYASGLLVHSEFEGQPIEIWNPVEDRVLRNPLATYRASGMRRSWIHRAAKAALKNLDGRHLR